MNKIQSADHCETKQIFELDARQAKVFHAIKKKSNKLAGLYCTILQLVAASPQAGCEIARVSVICHCGRELMNNLPYVFTEIRSPRIHPSSDMLKDKLPELLKDVDLDSGQDLVPVPHSAAIALGRLISTVTQEQGRNKRLASAFLTQGNDDEHPAIKQWNDAHDFFMRWTHFDHLPNQSHEVPDDDEIRIHLRVIEDVIVSRTNLFFDNLHFLQDILSEANGTHQGDAK